jgi:uncharacterized membrane-anchored protein
VEPSSLAWRCIGGAARSCVMPDQPETVPGPSSTAGSWVERLMGWMKRQEKRVLLIAASFQVLVLVAMIALHAAPFLWGETILVRVAPVDPRDLLRGDYVTLSYAFSRVPPQGIEGMPRDAWMNDPGKWEGRTVYVSLVPEPDGKHWTAEKFSFFRPATGKYLRGTLLRGGQLEFGIESYFVQEGKGYDYENAVRTRQLSAELAVTSEGQAAVRSLKIER